MEAIGTTPSMTSKRKCSFQRWAGQPLPFAASSETSSYDARQRATAVRLTLLTLALILPVGLLLMRSLEITPDWSRLLSAEGRSLIMGGLGAGATVILATLLALSAARLPVTARIASLGYGTPAAVMAI